ncbi:membrane protease YdiL (CAAX protease family) [Actinoplanes campanulatus]|uniref:Membrane protease YdiL (CAAX protease family) n=1 Tax=Actinoplanes campanulatus TaxID=113559 RepID=A0A7W5FJ56_9ACTN|nr:type II CAAX endopeptidase family protein [Actinoplanes campanulatus]MBB3100389.1 membrane protease YdiL (CAAX protease family) [Actinoplanes campanulatus]GGN24546.1 CAAX amino protease [Actinoplanes campanulatus]GID39573.1 CAAX amino protease [Actinoplanes campanulatus]
MTVEEQQLTTRPRYGTEIAIVLLLSLGQSAVYSVVSLTAKLTADRPLAQQTATLNASVSPRPYLDLTYQLLGIFFALIPVALALFLLARSFGAAARELGIDYRRPAYDLGWGAGLAAGIGLPGLLLVYGALQLGVNAQIVPSGLQPYWWSVPVLVLAALQNAVLEEVIVVGYLITRLRALSLSPAWIIAASAVLRGSYHLYQGFGAFLGNAVMGVIFALFYLRTKRVMPLIVAHSLLDITAFVGYELLPDSWLSWLEYSA